MNYTPCKNCLDRHVGCHSECKKYLKFKKDLKKVKEKEKTDKKIEADIWYGIQDAIKGRRR